MSTAENTCISPCCVNGIFYSLLTGSTHWHHGNYTPATVSLHYHRDTSNPNSVCTFHRRYCIVSRRSVHWSNDMNSICTPKKPIVTWCKSLSSDDWTFLTCYRTETQLFHLPLCILTGVVTLGSVSILWLRNISGNEERQYIYIYLYIYIYIYTYREIVGPWYF